MLRKLIITMLLISGVAYGQSTSGWSIVTTEGTNLYQDGSIIGADFVGNYFAPSYGSFVATATPYLVATNYTIDGGTLVTGTISSTWFEDDEYLQVNGGGAWTNEFYFTNSGASPRLVTFHGRVDGVPATTIKFKAYDFTNSVYTNFTVESTDLETTAGDVTLQFTFPLPSINFADTNGATRIQIVKGGVANADLYTDFLELTFATVVATNAGQWYPFAGFTVGQSNNIGIAVANSEIITTSVGDYQHSWFTSFSGATNTRFSIRHLTNGIPSGTVSQRTIGGVSQVGSMSAFGGGRQPAGTTNSWEFSANADDAWMSLVDGTAKIKKEAN